MRISSKRQTRISKAIQACALFPLLRTALSFQCWTCNVRKQSTPFAVQPFPSHRRISCESKTSHSYSRRDQLVRAIDSIAFYEPADETDKGASAQLKETLRELKVARNSSQVSLIGRSLQQLPILLRESRPIQERLVTVLASAGLLHNARQLLLGMLSEGYLPSLKACASVCIGLRKVGRLSQLEDLIQQLTELNLKQSEESISVVLWNIYLASLCDHADKKPEDHRLGEAFVLLKNREASSPEFDIVSYNTVLNAAAIAGNRSIVDSLWEDLTANSTHSKVEPDIQSYNSRLKITPLTMRCELWEEIQQKSRSQNLIRPDQYTIDLLLVPLLREKKTAAIEELLDDFVARSSERVVSNAFAAFLTNLIQKNEIDFARYLFDTYLLPCVLIRKHDGASFERSSMTSTQRPSIRHFNILLDGYKHLIGSLTFTAMSKEEQIRIKSKAFQKSSELVRIMKEYRIRADKYTLTSLMGLCSTSGELLKLITESKIEVTPAILRAAITAAGNLGDPGLACAIFGSSPKENWDTRLWNVLLASLAKGAASGDLHIKMRFGRVNFWSAADHSCHALDWLCEVVNGGKCTSATRKILETMRSGKAPWAPKPNSQTYCIVASALQYAEDPDQRFGSELFQQAMEDGIPADGRFINAIFRCFGANIHEAIEAWKTDMRQACLTYETRERNSLKASNRSSKKDLIAAYNGLLFVCGRALRPDIGLRLVYAMNREGIEPNEITLNNYRAGKRRRQAQEQKYASDSSTGIPKLLEKFRMEQQYESLLYVECTKYNQYNKRMSKDQRVRIII